MDRTTNDRTRGRDDIYKLENLSDYKLEHPSQDIRGQELITSDGQRVGRVDEMLVDVDRERVAAIRLDDDRVIDIDHIELRDDNQPVLLVPHEHIPRPPANFDRNNMTSEVIPVIEERLVVGKREKAGGTVRVHTSVRERPVHEEVTLREEHVDVNRRPVNERIDPREADRLMRDGDVEVRASSEEAVIGKEARVTEEVVVSKDSSTRTERVDDTLRKTEVEVEGGDRGRR